MYCTGCRKVPFVAKRRGKRGIAIFSKFLEKRKRLLVKMLIIFNIFLGEGPDAKTKFSLQCQDNICLRFQTPHLSHMTTEYGPECNCPDIGYPRKSIPVPLAKLLRLPDGVELAVLGDHPVLLRLYNTVTKISRYLVVRLISLISGYLTERTKN